MAATLKQPPFLRPAGEAKRFNVHHWVAALGRPAKTCNEPESYMLALTVGGTQLRRQATFLAAYDRTPDTGAWLAALPAAIRSRGSGRLSGSPPAPAP